MRTAVAAVALLYASIGFAGDISAAPTATIVIKVTESGFEPREVPVARPAHDARLHEGH